MADGYLTTHVLDTARGTPAAGIAVTLYRIEGANRLKLSAAQTNADGRTEAPILPKGQFSIGTYELVFEAKAYLDRTAPGSDTPRFLDEIALRFGVSDADAHYHVPLLLSPYGYSTYRGS